MKILYFHQHFTTPQGGTGTRSYELAKRLSAAGHEVVVVCGTHGIGETGLSGEFRRGMRRGEVAGFEVIEVNLPYDNRMGFLRRTWQFARFSMRSIAIAFRERYDVIFTTTTPLTVGIPGILARWIRRKPFVFEVRDLWPELPRAMGVIKNPIVLGLMSLLEWCSYRSADRLVALSPGIQEGIEKRGVAADRIAMIPNASDVSLFRQPTGGPWRPEELNGRKLVVFTGTHGRANGLDAVLDAAAVLKQRGRDDIAIALFGHGGMKSSLQQRAMDETLDNVHFYDAIPKTQVAQLMASADAGLQILANVPAFYYGTSPNKFFDYCAAGLPVICNYPGWVADLLAEHQAGIAAPPESPASLADAIERMCDDDELNGSCRLGAAKLGDQLFNRDALAGQFISWLAGDAVVQEDGQIDGQIDGQSDGQSDVGVEGTVSDRRAA